MVSPGKNRTYPEEKIWKNTFAIVQEYCKLSKLQAPSEKDIEKLTAILELAQYDPELSCLINGADHLIAYELGLSEELPHTTNESELFNRLIV